MRKFRAVLSIILIIALIAVFFAIWQLEATNSPGLSTSRHPTPNLTAVAAWTPTPDYPNQVGNLVKTAWPTPVTRIMPADREAFRLAFLEKLSAESINWSLLSSINHAGVAWRCTDIKLGNVSLPASTSGSLVAVWSAWYGGIDNSTMEVRAEYGSDAPPSPNLANNSIDIYKNAKVTIIFPNFGIVGPEIQQGNEVALAVDKPSILYGIWTTPREWITGEDIITQKQVDNVNYALDWAKIDSIAPLNQDGSRDLTYLNLLFDMTSGSLDPKVASIKLPNGDSVVLDHSLHETLLAIAKEAAVNAGYADVESLEIIISRPQNLNDYRYLANREVPVVPQDLATQIAESTCPLTQISPETITGLAEIGLPDLALEGILKRLLEIGNKP